MRKGSGVGTIVVGVDGSSESRRALRWAVEETRYRGGQLVVVYAYEFAPAWRSYALEAETATGEQLELAREAFERDEADAREHAHQLLEQALADLHEGDVDVTLRPVHSHHPAHTLVEIAADADLLVVGSRGRGGFAGLVLGSVSQQCVQHAPCPVTVVPSEP
jgi:nucleotide-binding universal stress UspA family protein